MAIAVLPFYRPKRAEPTWRRLRPAVALGVVLAVMNATFYESVDRLGLGVAATIEFLGPLAIALTSRRLLDVACAIAAGPGVLLPHRPWAGGGEARGADDAGAAHPCGSRPWGVVLALTAAAATGPATSLLTARRDEAARTRGTHGREPREPRLPRAGRDLDVRPVRPRLARPVAAARRRRALVGAAVQPRHVHPARITPRLYAIITSFGPVIAAVFGALVLGESFTLVEVIAIAVVCGAAGLALATQRDRPATDLEATAKAIP